MNKKEIMRLIKREIATCYKDLLSARFHNHPKEYAECFRCRLDELILLYQKVTKQSFVKACEELKVKYKDVDIQE